MICTEGKEKVYVCTRTHTCMHTHACTHTHAHTRMHTHACTHTYACVWHACPYYCPQVSHVAQTVKNPPTNAEDVM